MQAPERNILLFLYRHPGMEEAPILESAPIETDGYGKVIDILAPVQAIGSGLVW